ncbi:hypothetical protein ACFRCG_06115 [Embleya sp. NPDC056575]|uniref:hypothetical protein n=1 Tax=unclassified Embleya TaxID=2699296 RepID=UPI0036C434E4
MTRRRRMLKSLETGPELGDHVEAAVLPADTDPQLYLAYNRLAQPFHLICQHDTVLSQMSGTVAVHLRESSVNRFVMGTGDHVYVPAGTPHRLVPREEGVTLRYMPLDAGRLGVAWFCAGCGHELTRYEWEHDNDVPLSHYYTAACTRFTTDEAARTCRDCSAVHPEIDLSAFELPEAVGTA